MSGISTTQLKDELGAYFRQNHEQIGQMVYQKTKTAQYMRTVSKIKGTFAAPHTITDRVIQGFTTTWNELGTTHFRANTLVNYHQKINFPIIPAEVLGSWAAYLYNEKIKKEDMPISKYIADVELPKAIGRDQEYLFGKGVYDANALGTFGKSMNGIARIIADGKLDPDNPMYRIPVATLPLTKTNAVDIVEQFEEGIPEVLFDFIEEMPIFMGSREAYYYKHDARGTFGLMPSFDSNYYTTSNLTGRKIIGLPSLNGTNIMFCTPLDNFLRLIDLFDKPTITDIQVLDYKVKLFFEWWDGVAFYMNQLVLVADIQTSGSGLITNQDLYYA